VTIRSKTWRGTKFVKDTTKKTFFLAELKECETLEPVR